MSQFGKQRLADFYLDPKYININHGSYGSCPKKVMEVKRRYQQQMDFNAESWFRWDSEKLIDETRKYIASRVNCNMKNLFIVQNSTDAINCLAKSLFWEEGDTVLLPNTAYASIRKTFYFIRDHFKINFLQVKFQEEDFKSPEAILLKIENTVNSYPKKIKLAIIDHIISVPAVVCPVEAIRQFLDEKGIPLFIDGAHAMGQLPIDIASLQPAAYFSNFHKWAFSAKSAAFLYISDRYLDKITTAITGNFFYEGPARQFFWTGTRDFSSYLTIKPGLEYHDSFGKGAVQTYNHQLVINGSNKMASIWKTKVLTTDPRCIGSLHNVLVPTVTKQMLDNWNCYPVIIQFDGKIYCRVSAQIFNEMSDYEFAATKFLQILNSKEKQRESTKK